MEGYIIHKTALFAMEVGMVKDVPSGKSSFSDKEFYFREVQNWDVVLIM